MGDSHYGKNDLFNPQYILRSLWTIQREPGDIEIVGRVEGDATTKKITVQWDSPATMEKIKSTLKEINYPAAD